MSKCPECGIESPKHKDWCSKCNADNIVKEEHEILDTVARILVPEAKFVHDSAKRGEPVKCPRCGSVLPKHTLTCFAKFFVSPFDTAKMGQKFARDVEKAYCSKCNGFLPDHKDDCPLKKTQ